MATVDAEVVPCVRQSDRQAENVHATYSIKDVANLLGVSERSVRRYVDKFTLRTEYVFNEKGREVRVYREEVDRLGSLLSARVPDTAPSGQDAAAAVRQLVQKVGDSLPATLTREEVVEILAAAIERALERQEKKAKPGFQNTKPGRILTWCAYTIVGFMSIGCLAYALAIARKFDLIGVLLR